MSRTTHSRPSASNVTEVTGPSSAPAAGLGSAATRAPVTGDHGLAEDWMHTTVGAQRSQGLPPGLEDDLEWECSGALDIGFVGRRSPIALAEGQAAPRDLRAEPP